MLPRLTFRHAGSSHDERDANVLFVGGPLGLRQAVGAEVEAVVRG
jgi:prepilin-type processing-associated H-X9-DG protein